MATPVFDKETWLDITVNIIPLLIIGFFVLLYAVSAPWGFDGLLSPIAFALLITPFAILAYLTYVAAKKIEE